MKIGIDISQIVYKGSGVSRFTEGLVHAILTYEESHHWTFYFSSFRQKLDQALRDRINAKGFDLYTYPYPPTLLSALFNDWHGFSGMLLKHNKQLGKLDWFITSDWTEPPLPTKKATIVHDLVFKKFPETVHPSILKTQEKRLSHVVRESDLIFTDSHSTAQDLISEYTVDKNKIAVNYPGVETSEKTLGAAEDIIEKYGIHKPYILAVGKLEPRKNIERLIEAFDKAKTTAQLVIAGPKGWGTTDIKQSEHIAFLGFVPDEDLALLYHNALFFVYPSLYEGFGYPIIEAMRYQCPVAASSSSSMGEIAKDAAVLFDPENVQEITGAIQTLFDNEKLRADLIKKGISRAEKFTWKEYYNTLIKQLTSHV